MKKRLMAVILILCITFSFAYAAHPGRTDSSGGHKDNKNKSCLGSYHYHCGGHPAHLHKNGVCPYSSNTSSSKSTTAKSTTKSSDESASIKAVQEKLNSLGYDCGKADGVIGKKTTNAIKKFQKDKGLTVDGKIGPETNKALGL